MSAYLPLMSSPFPWLTDSDWRGLPVKERALLTAAHDADRLQVREKGGNNRGERVGEYLKSVGLGQGYPWCAAFVTFHLLNAGWKKQFLPKNPASVCSWRYESGLTVITNPAELGRGDLFLWCKRRKWQGHIGFVVRAWRVAGLWFIETIEGNTGPDGGRDGDGVYRKRRMWTPGFVGLRIP